MAIYKCLKCCNISQHLPCEHCGNDMFYEGYSTPPITSPDRSDIAKGDVPCPFCGGKSIEAERGSGEYTMCSTEPLWENKNGCPIGQMCIPTDKWPKKED